MPSSFSSTSYELDRDVRAAERAALDARLDALAKTIEARCEAKLHRELSKQDIRFFVPLLFLGSVLAALLPAIIVHLRAA